MPDSGSTPEPFHFTPIGTLRCHNTLKFDTRHQATEFLPDSHTLELHFGHKFEHALDDLIGFSHIWLIWVFHKNKNWRPKVLPPRGPAVRRGTFATRSPHRPNPIGISVVELHAIEQTSLLLGPTDLVDGTPILDIKPYIPAYDAFPKAKQGWLDEADTWAAAPPSYQLQFSPYAQEQANWLRATHQIDFTPRLEEILTRDPTPHKGRRIRPRGDTQFEIGCGAWRAVFETTGKTVNIIALEAGFTRHHLATRTDLPDQAAQIAHLSRYPEQPDRAR